MDFVVEQLSPDLTQLKAVSERAVDFLDTKLRGVARWRNVAFVETGAVVPTARMLREAGFTVQLPEPYASAA